MGYRLGLQRGNVLVKEQGPRHRERVMQSLPFGVEVVFGVWSLTCWHVPSSRVTRVGVQGLESQLWGPYVVFSLGPWKPKLGISKGDMYLKNGNDLESQWAI